jgi:hypothetical protein
MRLLLGRLPTLTHDGCPARLHLDRGVDHWLAERPCGSQEPTTIGHREGCARGLLKARRSDADGSMDGQRRGNGLRVGGRRGQRQERRRAGKHARQLVRNEWRDERRRFRKLLIQAVGGMLVAAGGVVALSAWWGVDRFVLGMLVGIGLTAVPLLVVQLKISTGIAARELGADAERWTAEELDKLDPRQWQVFHDVPVRWGNVDHVAVGPGRVYAIETKWTTSKGRFREGPPTRQRNRQRSSRRSCPHGAWIVRSSRSW